MKISSPQFLMGLTRLSLGWIFLWAFLDKVFGLGFATPAGKAWINGVSPTEGFLSFATKGPFASFFQSLAGHPVIDLLFMAGLLFVGGALIKGVMIRLASYAGALILFLIYIASALPPEHNPFMDDHLVYMLLLLYFAAAPQVGEYLGLGGWWKRQTIVQKYPILQ